ncbi:ABC transporter permease subunit [Streptomyces sp. NPDC057674]|uniref:ABC transporter permease subunit n=1 Tax=Streptomyces sp. NPDC057674 TaxID=3346203 RepID=UPI0036BF86D5
MGDLLTGDLGPSYAIGGQTADLIAEGLGATVELTLGALLFVVVLGGAFGILGATSRNRWTVGAVRILTTTALAVPPFVTGVLLVLLFSVVLGVLPPGGRVPLLTAPDLGVQYLVLPALCLALPSAAVLGRYLKDGIERALAEDYVRTATAAGIAPRRLLWRHALPNALPPVVTLLGMQTGHLLARLLHGIRADLGIIVVAVPLGAVLGCLLALAAAAHPIADTVVQRTFDLILAFPGLILALAVTAVLGPGRLPVILVVALAEIPVFGRLLRTGILVQRGREYVTAARVGGTSGGRILTRHILPNAADPLVVQIAVSLTVAVFIEGAMSFLGVGVRPPEPTLGAVLSQSMPYLAQAPHFAAGPLVTVTVLVLGLSLTAEALNREIRR